MLGVAITQGSSPLIKIISMCLILYSEQRVIIYVILNVLKKTKKGCYAFPTAIEAGLGVDYPDTVKHQMTEFILLLH